MRIVLDTNTVVSALLWEGTPYHLLQALRERTQTQLFSSPALLAELLDVMSRSFAAKRLALKQIDAYAVLADYVESVEVVEPSTVPRVVERDADDDHVIALAVECRAQMIVSGDRDLLVLESHRGIPIVAAGEALRRVGA